MKYLFYIIFLFGTIFIAEAQVSGQLSGGAGGVFGANGTGGQNPLLAEYMATIRNNKNSKGPEILGSPYLTDDFVKSKVFFGDQLIGDYFIRYNALVSEIEIKTTDQPEEEPKKLIAHRDLKVKYGSRELLFTTYINRKDETKNGFLSIIEDGDHYTLYHRLAVKYSEGKTAANSMVNDIPSRYVPFVEYYYKKSGVNRIDQLAQKKGRFLKQLAKEDKEKTELFIKENNIDLGKESDLIKVFEFINS